MGNEEKKDFVAYFNIQNSYFVIVFQKGDRCLSIIWKYKTTMYEYF